MQRTKCEVFTRIVGYIRPVQNWNKGKKEEFGDRVTFREKVSLESAQKIEKCKPLEAFNAQH
ncbi:hypothetical protein HOD38_02565 [archaeon]|jgi:hypothetical protein|nr:hypothetical protein [archaeon]MBT4397126.1 hypothetical protein [archaeon]MBT4441568.1 hypothetical protein [archaeon]